MKVDFFRDPHQGQMKPAEREAMYNMVVQHRPRRMLEIGTWRGGGSTYILASAAWHFGGLLDTIECHEPFQADAVRLFEEEFQPLLPHVKFHLGRSEEIIPRLLDQHQGYDFVLLDGAEDAAQTVVEYSLLSPGLRTGSILACHDWKTWKMAELKKLIGRDSSWHEIVSIRDTETGFQMFERK
jgi:predicted O-methyltransferase YrrM